MKKIAIIRGSRTKISIESYNSQEIGLGTALLNNYGISVDIYICGDKFAQKNILSTNEGTVNYISLPIINLPGKQGYMKGLNSSITKQGYDLIQTHEYHLLISWQAAFIAKKNKIPAILYQGPNQDFEGRLPKLIQFFHDLLIWPLYKKLFLGFIAKTHSAAEYLKQKDINHDIAIIPVGLDTDKFKQSEKLDIKKALGLPYDAKILLNVGNIIANKNAEFLLDVVAETNKTTDCYFVWIGKKNDKEYFNKCEDKIKQLGIEDKVYFPGSIKQNNLPDIYQSSDLLLYKTNTGIFGMVFLEAMYFGLPIVTNSIGGSEQIIGDSESGILLKSNNIQEWSNKITEVLNNPELMQNYKIKAVNRINDVFVWNKAVIKFYDFYMQINQK